MTNPTTNYVLGKIQHAEYESRFGNQQSERNGVAKATIMHTIEALVLRTNAKVLLEKREKLVTCQGDI